MNDFDFLSPRSLNTALRAISTKGRNYKIIAGGTNLVPDMRSQSISPRWVIDLGGIDTLRFLKEERGLIRIGALTTMADLVDSKLVRNRAPLLWQAASRFAGPIVRNRATVGGNLVDASPAADSAVPLLALQAQVKLQSLKGKRTMPLEQFFADYRKTALRPGEILTEIAFPIPERTAKSAYHKMGRRNAMAISVVSVGVLLKMKGDICSEATVALGAVAPTPIRVLKVESLLQNRKVDLALAKNCGELAAKSAHPIDDLRASADYRRKMCAVYVQKAICRSVGLADE
ncbi:MAG: xanthine dehydrogenase family protein subunit M [Deltaproteobacteria bacterium]|nr:MAG: xanthine dehydrogenase family protein subunit M [Deltaproteobacteria bacterium]